MRARAAGCPRPGSTTWTRTGSTLPFCSAAVRWDLQRRIVHRQLRGLQPLARRFLRPRSQALRRRRLCADAGCRCRDHDDARLRQARAQGDQHPCLPDGQVDQLNSGESQTMALTGDVNGDRSYADAGVRSVLEGRLRSGHSDHDPPRRPRGAVYRAQVLPLRPADVEVRHGRTDRDHDLWRRVPALPRPQAGFGRKRRGLVCVCRELHGRNLAQAAPLGELGARNGAELLLGTEHLRIVHP